MSTINNNNNDCEEISAIRNISVKDKIEFIRNIVSQSGIPIDFKKIMYTDEKKIFFAGEIKREWILFSNQKFFCVYCLCFSSLTENRFVKGVEYSKKNRVTEKLNAHGKEKHHQIAKSTYLNKVSISDGQCEQNSSEKRKAIKCIIKIIIFISTHG